MNWGYKILAMYGAFIFLIAALVFGSYRQQVNLVSKDYYQREIDFQQVIDGRQNLTNRGLNPEITVTENQLTIKLPEGKTQVQDLEIWMYHAVASSADIKFNVKKSKERVFTFTLGPEHTGRYQLKIKWKENELPYYYEQEMSI